jgi:uncharacterized protein DUF6754
MVGFLRLTSPAVTATIAVILLFMSLPVCAQPLVPGVSAGNDRYFLDDGKLKVLGANGSLETLDPGPVGDLKGLFQPEGWGETFLAQGDKGFVVLKPDSRDVIDTTPTGPAKGSELKSMFFLWGSKAAWRVEGLNVINWVGPDENGKITESEGIVGEIAVYGEKLLYLTANGEFRLLNSDRPDEKMSGKLPFPVEDARITTSGDRAIIWSPNSKAVVAPGSEQATILPEIPALGASAMDPNGIALEAASGLMVFAQDGTFRTIEAPTELKEDFVKTGRFFEHNGAVLLLSETSQDETKVHDNGKVVSDPKTGKVVTHSVKGYKLLSLADDWKEIMADPRAKIVGPARRIGDNLIFATQSEPLNQEGVKRSVDGRYPYPKVVFHAVSLKTGVEVWTLDLPRGKSPSLARLPDSQEWPLWGSDQRLLYTTEDDALAALDTKSGKVLWVSEGLPLDESRPGMVAWDSEVGLVAVKNTTQNFLLFDDEGKLVESIRLNDLFNHARKLNLIGVVVICLALILYIYLAGKKKLFIRRIAGLEALDEAVGRSTEMGKPVLYVTGLADVDDIQTLAALSILSHVAKKTAEYDTQILATTSRAVTFSAAQEVVRDAFTIAGRPDSFSVESVRYISDDQFGYAAGVDGLMVREKPAANFYMGKFYAESLIFAETGNATGAIQIAGTAQANQLPFFVAACDYTLIGEELFAASAYLSGDPLQVGSLRGQDVGKAIVMVILVVLSIDATFDGHLTKWLAGLIGVNT